jgi:hypothetical protein
MNVADLRAALTYNPETGRFHWREGRGRVKPMRKPPASILVSSLGPSGEGRR